MKHFTISTILTVVLFAVGCDSLTKLPTVSEGKSNGNTTVSQTSNSVAPNAANDSEPVNAPTPTNNKNAAANVKKTPTAESLPRKINDDTAESPVYGINSKNCKNQDALAGEGEDFVRQCKGFGGYDLVINGMDYRKNYGITSAKKSFNVMLFPLESGYAQDYVRADLYDQKLGDKIEWRLDEKGEPFAVIVRAFFYKNTGSAKTFDNPKNKVAEFLLVRGLAGYEDLKFDVPTTNTAYDPNEHARLVAYKFLESKQK